eukprot:gene6249-4498_t
MSFLDEVPLSNAAVCARPSFLDDDSRTEDNDGPGVPSFLTPETTPRRPGTSGAFMKIFDGQRVDSTTDTNGVSRAAETAAAAFALEMEASLTNAGALSSAEELHFPCTSLRQLAWDLYRSKILGKGSFGCATLYSTDRQMAAAGLAGAPGSCAFAVVKDVNIQTMTCREEEMAALRDEVTALERVAGHPNTVQLLDYHHDELGMMAYIITEFCEGGDVAGVIERAKRGEYVPPVPLRKCSYASSTSAAPLKKMQHIPEEVVSSVLIQVVVALNHLHIDNLILHRDLKPHNLFLLSDGITVRLGDFGVAALLQSVTEKAKLVMKGKCIPLWERTNSSGEPITYSRELMDLVMSMLTVDPTARPTLRRLLRSSYVRKNLYTVPKNVLQTGHYYEKVCETNEWLTATEKSLFPGVRKSPVQPSQHQGEDEDDYEDDFEDED